jgi:hypothetical protein
VAQYFPRLAKDLRTVEEKLNRLPGAPPEPEALARLGDVLEECIRMSRQTKPTVMLVKKHLDALREGVRQLRLYDAELTAEAIRAVNEANNTLLYQAAQLEELESETADVEAAANQIDAQLKSERPWRDIGAIGHVLAETQAIYVTERERLLQWQEQQVEQARMRVKGRDGFSTLTADQSHRVLRPLAGAVTDTSAEAVAPSLAELEDPFILRLERAEEAANEILDQILSEGDKPLITTLDLHLRGRELANAADVAALVDEIETRLLEQIGAGVRVRLL